MARKNRRRLGARIINAIKIGAISNSWYRLTVCRVSTLQPSCQSVCALMNVRSTRPIAIFQQVDSGRLGLASAYSVILMLAIFVPLAVARWGFRIKVDAVQ